nr:hypothetical protein [Tanacetum cinerariifolium]
TLAENLARVLWYRQPRIVLFHAINARRSLLARLVYTLVRPPDKLNYLEQPIPVAPVLAQAGQQVASKALAAHDTWVKRSKEIVRLMLMTMDSEIQRNLERLERLEHPVTTGLGVSLILISLRKDFDGFVQNYNMHNMGKTISELHAMLKLHEQTQPKNNASALHAIRAGKRAAVEAIGSYHLSLPGGLVIVLNNCHYAPSITKGIISVSHLYDDGYVNQFVDNSIQVSRNNMVYFNVVLRDGIIEIDLFDFYTNVEKTPYEVWHGKSPKLSYLKVWGCEALVKRDTLTKPDKLEPRSIKCNFIGYPKEIMGYSFYYPFENKVLVARNAEFLENGLIPQKASGGLEDLEIIQEEDTHPSIGTSLNHKEDDLEIDEPQSDIIPIRRSTRTRNAADRMCLYIDVEEHELGDLGEPANYKAALLDPEFDKWQNAMNVETQSMKDNEVWDLVELPPNGKTIGSKWLFKKKTDTDGAVHTYKARLVVKGYTQTLVIDYEETFSPVAYIGAIRILIAI